MTKWFSQSPCQNMQSDTSTSKQKRSIFSNFIYRTSNNDRRLTEDFKKISAGCFLDRQTCTHPSNISKELSNKLSKLEISQDSTTQTSKTILELALIESGNISPDSLNGSPKPRLENVETQVNLKNFELSDDFDEYYFEKSKIPDFDERTSEPRQNSANSQTEEGNSADDILNECADPNSNVSKTSNRSLFLQQTSPLRRIMLLHENEKPNNSIFNEIYHPNIVYDFGKDNAVQNIKVNDNVEMENCLNGKYTNHSSTSSSPRSSTRSKKSNSSSYMAPTISSENKNAQNIIRQLNQLFVPNKRGRSASPKTNDNQEDRIDIPYVGRSNSTMTCDSSTNGRGCLSLPPFKPRHIRKEEQLDYLSLDSNYSIIFKDILRNGSKVNPCISTDNFLTLPLAKLRDPDWNVCIQGLAEVIDLCRIVDTEMIYPHMTVINQKVIELLRSPRTHICRTACQAAGHLIEYVRDTRRPEFDEIVDLLLFKTADANKFIRQDANLALDCMVTHIPYFHSIRALCSKGPTHKNHLVRTATVRLIVCAVVIAGADNLLSPNGKELTTKRIFYHLPKFLADKNLDVRRFAERLYKVLSKEFRFELYLKKYLDKEEILKMKKNLRNIAVRS